MLQRQITHKMPWYQLDTITEGIVSYPAEDFSKQEISNLHNFPIGNIEMIEGYGARLSASGYMDCTEWSVFSTVEEAKAYLDEYYPENEDK